MYTVFNDAGEQELRKVVLYAHTDNFLYVDDTHKTKVAAAKLLDMCMKGLVLVTADGKTFTSPVAFKNETTYVSVNVEAGKTTTADIKTYKSDNFTA